MTTNGERWYDVRLVEAAGVFHVHHHGTKAAARERARRMAEYHWPREDGYRLRWSNDCISAFHDGKHCGDMAVEPLEAS